MEDRRSRRSRLAVYGALQALLAEKSYDRITVQDIITRADIGRSTFYHHFETRDEVLRSLCAELFAHVFAPEASILRDASPAPAGTLRDQLIHILSHLRAPELHLTNILRTSGEADFMKYFRKYAEETFRSRIDFSAFPVPRDFLLETAAAELYSTLRWWLSGNTMYTAGEIADFYLAAAPEKLFIEPKKP